MEIGKIIFYLAIKILTLVYIIRSAFGLGKLYKEKDYGKFFEDLVFIIILILLWI